MCIDVFRDLLAGAAGLDNIIGNVSDCKSDDVGSSPALAFF